MEACCRSVSEVCKPAAETGRERPSAHSCGFSYRRARAETRLSIADPGRRNLSNGFPSIGSGQSLKSEKSVLWESVVRNCHPRDRWFRRTEINPDESPLIVHSRNRSIASDVGHKWRPTRIRAKRIPVDEAVARTSKPSATMWDNVIPEISTIHPKDTFALRPFVPGSATRSLDTGTGVCAIRR